MKNITLLILLLSFSPWGAAHSQNATATYMGNEALLISSGQNKIVFDPLFHNDFGQYQKVPKPMLNALFKAEAPFDHISAIFISHAHDDHFNAQSVLTLLKQQNHIKLFAPKQAVAAIASLGADKEVKRRITAVALELGDPPWIRRLENLLVEAVRVPHGGYPYRHEAVENLVFRVTLDDKTTIIHMGDAEPDDRYFKPYKQHWQKRLTHTAFPPYWFYANEQTRWILDKRINATNKVGIHVPVKVPKALRASGLDYFSKPGETRTIE